MKKKFIFSFIFIIIICFLSSCKVYDEGTRTAMSKSKISYVFDLIKPGYHFVSWKCDDMNKIKYQDKDDSLYELLTTFDFNEIDDPIMGDYPTPPLYEMDVYSECDSNNKTKKADNTISMLVYGLGYNTICVTYTGGELLSFCIQSRYYSISDEDFELLINKLESMSIEDNIIS